MWFNIFYDFIIIIFFVVLILSLFFNFKKYYIISINYIYLLKFICFNILLIIYYCFYLVIFSLFFIFKNFRFYKYYFANIGTAFYYYNKLSIYFLFWRYLVMYLRATLFFLIIFFKTFILIKIKNFILTNNNMIYLCIYIKTKLFINGYLLNKIISILYNFYIFIVYHLFYFINIDEIMSFLYKWQINILNILKYNEDPILHRNLNIHLKWFNNVNYFNMNILFFNKFLFKNKNIMSYIKKYIYGYIVHVMQQLHLYFDPDFNRGLKLILSNLYLSSRLLNVLNNKHILLKLFQISFYLINFFLVNCIYIIMLFFIYNFFLFFSLINFLKNYILFIFLFFLCIKYYWFIYYYIVLLSKHYFLYVPLFNVKESIRFLNFEWIDLRNYFNLVFLHNSLVDISILNNTIYNDLLHNLNKTLSLYGFKVGSLYDINLHSLLNIQNKDTKLLDELFSAYNEAPSNDLLEWYTDWYQRIDMQSKSLFKYSKMDQNVKINTFYKKYWERSLKSTLSSVPGEVPSYMNSLSYMQMNREFFFKDQYKKNSVVWKMFNKHYFFDNIYDFIEEIAVNKNNIIKCSKIPLRFIYLYDKNFYADLQKKLDYHLDFYKGYFPVLYLIQKHTLFYLSWFKKIIKSDDFDFFFGRFFDYDNINDLNMKHKIPTFNWTPARWRRKIANNYFLSSIMGNSVDDDDQDWTTYFDLAHKKMKKKRYYQISYLYEIYPYNLYNDNVKKNIIDACTVLKSNIKVIKKFFLLKNSQVYQNKHDYKLLLQKHKVFSFFFKFRLNYWKNPLLKKELYVQKTLYVKRVNKFQVNEFNYNFWFFFEYLKTDKYYYSKYPDIYNENSDINLYFIKRLRKDYIKLKNRLLRLYSLYFTYSTFERSNLKHFFYDQRLPTFQKNERLIDQYENFKINWLFKIYLTKEKENIDLYKKIFILSKLFKKHFYTYFVYCDYTINTYNDLYYIPIKNYKIKVLNKINNLKRFFYFQNKHMNGWSIFKYLNSFSLKFHIKHFIWHSPYSFLLFKDDYIANDYEINLNNNNFDLFYNVAFKKNKENDLIDVNNYSFIFNFFLNVTEIKRDWYYLIGRNWYQWHIASAWFYYLVRNYDYINPKWIIQLYSSSFTNYYYYGHFVYKTMHMLDVYRFTMNFLFEYYNNFLYRLTRYHYILDYKNYTIVTFLKRYFNIWEYFKHCYFRVRLQVYRYSLYGKHIRRQASKIFPINNIFAFRVYRKQLVSFWFFFDYYIKLFIYFLLNKYYTKQFFIVYWFYCFRDYLNYNPNCIFIYLSYYHIKYIINYTINEFKFQTNYNEWAHMRAHVLYLVLKLILNNLLEYVWDHVLYHYNVLYDSLKHYNKYLYVFMCKDMFININMCKDKSKDLYLYINMVQNMCKDKSKDLYLYINIAQNMCKDIIISIKNYIYYLWDVLLWVYSYFEISYNLINKIKIFNVIISYIYNKITLFVKMFRWYILIIFEYKINIRIIYNFNYLKGWLLLKWSILIFNKWNINNFNFNKIILKKIYIEKLLIYYFNIIFNIKNTLVYFKPNYFYFRKQRGVNHENKLDVFNGVFTQTKTLRNIYSFKHLTNNVTFFKNIYLINTSNYIYLYNDSNINIDNVFNLFFFLFKYNYMYLNIFFYIVLYWLIISFLFLYYKKFYNLLFFCQNVNVDPQYNWNKLFNDSVVTLSKIHNRTKHKMFKVVKKKKNFNFYKFNLFNKFYNKISKLKYIAYYTTVINKYNNIKINNNEIIEINIMYKDKTTEPFFFIKYLNMFKNFCIEPFTLKKNNNIYNFYFLDYLNNNVLNFCIFYWFLLIPYFFFEYILMRYHLRGHMRIKRHGILMVKILFDNFSWFIKLNKVLGNGISIVFKHKRPRCYNGVIVARKRKRLRFGFYLKWDRLHQKYIRMSPLGSYYYWFFKINRIEYLLSYYKYFFNWSFKSYYYSFIYIYFFIFFFIIKKKTKKYIFKLKFINSTILKKIM